MITPSTLSTLYVSKKTGHVAYTGFTPVTDAFRNGPLSDLEDAFRYIREMRQAGYMQPITIRILDEEYPVSAPITIDSTISNVTIESCTHTILCGGYLVTGWQHDSFNGIPCFSAEIPEIQTISSQTTTSEQPTWYTDFYVDGKRAEFSRYPETGTLTSTQVENDSNELCAHSNWFIAEKEDFDTITNLHNLTDCIISYNHHWIDEHSRIADFDDKTGKITFETPSTFTISPKRERSALHYVIEHVAETFRQPNQWYLDRTVGKIYYIPAYQEQTPENIKAYLPICDKIFVLKGTPEQPVANITLKNLHYAYTRGEGEWIGFDGVRGSADVQSTFSGTGTLEMEYAHNCSIEQCTISCTGIHGIHLYNGCQNIRIENNILHDIGAGGIALSGGVLGSDQAEHTCYITIHNNHLYGLGKRYYAACGILLRHAYNNRISHNEIHDLYYSGISAGWVWGYADSICRDNLIEFNHIYDLGKNVLSDMGGIYLLGKQPGTIVRNNIIHGVNCKHYGGWGIYTDEGSSFILIENNICCDLCCNGMNQHYGSMNTVRHNIFAGTIEHPVKFGRPEMHVSAIFEHNLLISTGTSIYDLSTFYSGSSHCGQGYIYALGAHGNLLADSTGKSVSVLTINDKNYSLEEVQKLFGIEEGSKEVLLPFSRENLIQYRDYQTVADLGNTIFREYGLPIISINQVGLI